MIGIELLELILFNLVCNTVFGPLSPFVGMLGISQRLLRLDKCISDRAKTSPLVYLPEYNVLLLLRMGPLLISPAKKPPGFTRYQKC